MRDRSVSESATHSPGPPFDRDPTIHDKQHVDYGDGVGIGEAKGSHRGHVDSDGHRDDHVTEDPPPPPLPPRRKMSALDPSDFLTDAPLSPGVELAQPRPTVALQPVEIQTLSFPDGSRGTFSSPALRAVSSTAVSSGLATPLRPDSDRDAYQAATDGGSVRSLAPPLRPPADLASLVAGELNRKSRAWSLLRSQSAHVPPFEADTVMPALLGADADTAGLASFKTEFDDIPEAAAAAASSARPADDGYRALLWKAKMKHFLILSSAGKPIYSRHGDLSLVNSHMGVIRTIISFYEEAKNALLGFTAGGAGAGATRFIVSAPEGTPLYLVGISRGLGESDGQLRAQLDALYMQILSTLTLPTLQNIFANRPGSDLRKPLQGTDQLLSSLADSFTRGSPSALLGALECLRLRKSHRHVINNAFLRVRAEKLLYGLIVAGGRLVSVIRPRRHSLHPGDLQIIFNMLFESGGIRAGGGESWIPICLPAFNNRGYLYMYVSFFGKEEGRKQGKDEGKQHAQSSSESQQQGGGESGESRPATRDADHEPLSVPSTAFPTTTDDNSPDESASGGNGGAAMGQDEIAIILISPDRESFFDLKEMRDKVAEQLTRNSGLAIIRTAVQAGRPRVASIAPGLSLAHFLFKSRANVQFCMSSLDEPALGYSQQQGQDYGPAEGGDGGGGPIRGPSNVTTTASSSRTTVSNTGISSASGGSGSNNPNSHANASLPTQPQKQLAQPPLPPPPTSMQTQPLTQAQLLARRRLMTLYHELHAAAHARHTHLRVLHVARRDACGLAWVAPTFELYCVCGPNASRAAAAAAAEKIVQWAKKEEERLFIIGGGVF